MWTQRDSNCAQPPVKGSTSQSIKKHPCGCFCVDPERFELSTFSMPLRRAPNCAMGPCLLVHLFSMALPIPRKGTSCAMGPCLLVHLFPMALPIPRKGTVCAMGPCLLARYSNGPGGIRTLDLFSAIEARSQLRYRPVLHPDFKNKYSNGLIQECQAFFGLYVFWVVQVFNNVSEIPNPATISGREKKTSSSSWFLIKFRWFIRNQCW